MIYVVDKEDGSKQKYVIPDNARIMTEEDSAYFQAKADEATAQRNRNLNIAAIRDEINELIGKISDLKRNLNRTDYQAIKFAEGEILEIDYAPIKEQRKSWRKQINDYEAAIASKEATIKLL